MLFRSLFFEYHIHNTDDSICRITNFSLLCVTVNKSPVIKRLLTGLSIAPPNDVITLFAPTNAAFTAAGITESTIESWDANLLLNQILRTHIAPGKFSAFDLQCDSQLSMLLKTTTTQCATARANNGKAQTGAFNTDDDLPMILTPNNIEACNGFIQPISNIIRSIQF